MARTWERLVFSAQGEWGTHSWVISAKAVCVCLLCRLVCHGSQLTVDRKALSPVAAMARRRIETCPRTPSLLEAENGARSEPVPLVFLA